MRLNLFMHFLTLVVVGSSLFVPVNKLWAAGDSEVIPDPINTKPNNPQLEFGPTLTPRRQLNERTFTSALGFMQGHIEDKESVISSTYLSFMRTNYNRNFTAQEYGIILLDRGLMGASLGFKTLPWPGEFFEPFFKGALGAIFKPSESIGTFINFDRYQLQVMTGFEDVLNYRRRIRFEIGAAHSSLGLTYFANLGYVIGF